MHQTFVDWWLSWIDCIGMMYVDQIQSDIVLYFFVIPKPNELVGTRMPLLVHNHIIPIGLNQVLWLHISSSSTTRDFGHEESLVWQIGRLCLLLVGKESQWCIGDLPTCFLRRAYAFAEVFFCSTCWATFISLDWFSRENLHRKPMGFLPSNWLGFRVNFPIIQFYFQMCILHILYI